MNKDFFEEFTKSQNEITKCPNCGRPYKVRELIYSSTKRYESVPHGSCASTLYGVCKECADNHS